MQKHIEKFNEKQLQTNFATVEMNACLRIVITQGDLVLPIFPLTSFNSFNNSTFVKINTKVHL